MNKPPKRKAKEPFASKKIQNAMGRIVFDDNLAAKNFTNLNAAHLKAFSGPPGAGKTAMRDKTVEEIYNALKDQPKVDWPKLLEAHMQKATTEPTLADMRIKHLQDNNDALRKELDLTHEVYLRIIERMMD